MIYNSRSFFRLILAMLSVCCVVSCKTDQPAPSGFSWCFMPRDCEYLFVHNGYVKPLSEQALDYAEEHGLDTRGTYVRITETVPSDFTADKYCLTLDITSYTPEMLKDANNDIFIFLASRDAEMEDIMDEEMRREYKSTRSSGMSDAESSAPRMYIKYIEYRKEELKSLKITSTSTLFGLAAGTDLTGYFDVWGDENNAFLFDWNKKFLGKLTEDMSVRDYLALRPIVSPLLILHIRETPQEVPIKAEFIVEMELAGDKHFRASTSIELTN